MRKVRHPMRKWRHLNWNLNLRLGLGPQVPEVEKDVAHEGCVGNLEGDGRVVRGGGEGIEAAGDWSGNSRQHLLKVSKNWKNVAIFQNGQLFNDNKWRYFTERERNNSWQLRNKSKGEKICGALLLISSYCSFSATWKVGEWGTKCVILTAYDVIFHSMT